MALYDQAPSARPSEQLLVWISTAAIVFATVLNTRLYLTTRANYALMIVIASAVVGLALGGSGEPGFRKKCLRDLAPMIGFALVSIAVYVVTAVRISAEVGALLNVCLAPSVWFSAAALGYIAGRRTSVPAVVAVAASVWVSGLAGLLSVAQRAGLDTGLGRAYVLWSTSIGSWQPSAAEPFRSVGLEIDPNTFGLLGLVGLLFALTFTGFNRSRVFIAAGAVLVLVLSGSRTAASAAVLGSVMWIVPSIGNWQGLRERWRQLAPTAVGAGGMSVALLLAAGLSRARVVIFDRFAATARAVGQSGAGAAASASEATGGRLEIWGKALNAYAHYPFGAFLPPEQLVGRSIHNEFIERLLYGGPLMVAALLGLFVWIFLRARPAKAPAFGPVFAVGYAVAAVGLGPSLLPPFMVLACYLIGWALSPEDGFATDQQPDSGALA